MFVQIGCDLLELDVGVAIAVIALHGVGTAEKEEEVEVPVVLILDESRNAGALGSWQGTEVRRLHLKNLLLSDWNEANVDDGAAAIGTEVGST